MSATSDASATARAPLEGAKPLEDVDVVDLLRRAYTTKELQAQYADALGRKTTCHNKTWILEKIGERASLREHAAALMPDVKEVFDFGDELGRGQFGAVFAVTEKSSGRSLACKSISKRDLKNETRTKRERNVYYVRILRTQLSI